METREENEGEMSAFNSFIGHVLKTYPTYDERAAIMRENGFGIIQTIENLASKDRLWAFHGNKPFVKDSTLKLGVKNV